ncbi:MAG: PQQ-binding-like beta-propeller repeat protein [Planctomycetes bacterium]|nr:PQQ-binding-like beta-propeller repeat protein [Planctomycetota bacterium]
MLLLFAASPTFGGDWETGVGGSASRAGLSTDVGPLSANILWQGSLPAIVAGQAVIGQDLGIVTRITSFTIPTGTTIVAHDRLTGDIVWTAQLPFNFPDSWRSRVSAIRDNQVYATRSGNTAADFLYALDPADGEILWESEDVIVESSTESPSFAENGDLIVGSFGSLMRIDRTDGSTVWSVPRSCPTTPLTSPPSGPSAPLPSSREPYGASTRSLTSRTPRSSRSPSTSPAGRRSPTSSTPTASPNPTPTTPPSGSSMATQPRPSRRPHSKWVSPGSWATAGRRSWIQRCASPTRPGLSSSAPGSWIPWVLPTGTA